MKGHVQDVDGKDRATQHRRLWILLASLVSFFVVFWWLNFRVAASNTQSEKNIITTSIGMEGNLPDAIQQREKINIALVGEGPLIAALQKALAVEMNNTGLGDIAWAQQIEPKYQTPVLVVKVGKPSLLWTPFFATSRFTLQAGYSSSGDATLIGETPATIDNENGAAINMYAEYKVSDRSWGLLSRPGYHQALADYLAEQIVATLKDLYRIPASTDESYGHRIT
jgi:hypothetical protein